VECCGTGDRGDRLVGLRRRRRELSSAARESNGVARDHAYGNDVNRINGILRTLRIVELHGINRILRNNAIKHWGTLVLWT
jgi:hypothetical protein